MHFYIQNDKKNLTDAKTKKKRTVNATILIIQLNLEVAQQSLVGTQSTVLFKISEDSETIYKLKEKIYTFLIYLHFLPVN